MHFTYCPDCGEKLIPRTLGDEGAVPWCTHCERPLFDMFSTCVLSVPVSSRGEIGLIRQSYGNRETFVGVAGYMKPGETAEEAALRELSEEIGLTGLSLRFQFSAWHESRGQLMLCFAADVPADAPDFRLSGEVTEAKWFSPEAAAAAVRSGSIIERLVQQVCQNLKNC